MFIIFGMFPILKNFLDFLEYVRRNKKFVCSFVGFTAEVDYPDVKFVTQNPFDSIEMKHFTAVSCYAKFLEESGKVGKRAFAFGEKLKCFFDDFGLYGINFDCP
ncbi:hypothetical protein A2873_04340 [Candidatus Woesebacteria bacterium RIFCSPHIGHO2_01_FULL_42_80]|uniref:Uncharacterized protein n=1 Tax=Candidatus Woesebacteria bacterium RIFCSPHIGHO2_12_FULL_41_24 TaxID=1802510 RepID=A0A1F8AV04_9BACT|nr:MAG: hypothetical protein A2W15_00155 [Candidatus Woesebacteria bacterium RBG_16_41_13]OGM28463.1 MAG: hypothetical protein A2873_04340 [Candidatus Woesebacteria bacterium RIFCSPHIGHO2_01_FULL_42_80]OGM55567.1 MAG: hypothetical protein A3E44_04870 [Candidatus Woesebacteria bacterium RIFCSPHIGHO2_12_FULL_41_24]OGM67357.1 MAG: hypothetical protein A2969_02845 [Candidatus Woesebacteria bacterium RIFCSPLOWO2_01_FULL_42_67]